MCILQGIVLKNVKKHKKQAEMAQRSGEKECQQAAENDVERGRK